MRVIAKSEAILNRREFGDEGKRDETNVKPGSMLYLATSDENQKDKFFCDLRLIRCKATRLPVFAATKIFYRPLLG